MPWQAPAIAPVIAAIVSLSPPSEAAVRHACQGSWGCSARTANAAGTDSCVGKQVQGSSLPDPAPPGEQPTGEIFTIDTATAGQQRVGREQCLLRLVGDRADRQPRCDHMVCGRLAKPVEDTEARSDLFLRH